MKTTMAFRLFHVIMCPFLIFGWWFFPRLGVSGAAVTNVLSQSVGATIGLWFLLSARTRLRLTFRDFHLDPGMIWRIVRIGIPGSISGMERTFGQAF
jgi:Na+-driven multidrug efflux pump